MNVEQENDVTDDTSQYDETEDSDCSQQTSSSNSIFVEKKTPKGKQRKQKSKKNRNNDNPLNVKPKLNYKCTNFIKEDHKQPIFGVQFYQHLVDSEDDPLIFGTVGSNRVSIYKCGEDCGRINLLQSYADSDEEESFYACTWTRELKSSDLLFCFAGTKGVIHVLNVAKRQLLTKFQGHGSAINELKTHPLNETLILSTSKGNVHCHGQRRGYFYHTIRMWNIKSEVCVAIFAGVDGHRDEVLGIDFDILGTRVVSCGMDHSLKFWSLETDKMKEIIEESRQFSTLERKTGFNTLAIHYPEFTTRDVHRNYIDCCIWLGDLVLSKSCDNQVVCWKVKQPLDLVMSRKNNADVGVFILHKFDIALCDIWFMRFAVDYNQTVLAIGNQVGKIYLYHLAETYPSTAKPTILQHTRCTTAVRQISFNVAANILVAVCDDGTVWRYDRQTK